MCGPGPGRTGMYVHVVGPDRPLRCEAGGRNPVAAGARDCWYRGARVVLRRRESVNRSMTNTLRAHASSVYPDHRPSTADGDVSSACAVATGHDAERVSSRAWKTPKPVSPEPGMRETPRAEELLLWAPRISDSDIEVQLLGTGRNLATLAEHLATRWNANCRRLGSEPMTTQP